MNLKFESSVKKPTIWMKSWLRPIPLNETTAPSTLLVMLLGGMGPIRVVP
jgi:hypothetical protein